MRLLGRYGAVIAFGALCILLAQASSVFPKTRRFCEAEGKVYDVGGAVVPHALVIILNERTGTWRRTETQNDGRYGFGSIKPGHYELYVLGQGFRRVVERRKLSPSEKLNVDFRLIPGGGSMVKVQVPPGERLASTGWNLGGEVDYESGHPLAGARVVITDVQTLKKYATRTARNGEFKFADLPFGSYVGGVQSRGYEPQYRVVTSDRLNFRLRRLRK